jgi:hypothetical protein
VGGVPVSCCLVERQPRREGGIVIAGEDGLERVAILEGDGLLVGEVDLQADNVGKLVVELVTKHAVEGFG